MSGEYSPFNILSGSDMSDVLKKSWYPVNFKTNEVKFGTPYALSVTYDSSADGLWFQARFDYWTTSGEAKALSDTPPIHCDKGKHVATLTIPRFDKPDDFNHAYFMIQAGYISGTGTIEVSRPMLVEGDKPAAWAPAEGETLAGGGALVSANLLDGITPTLNNGTTESGGVWHNAGRTSVDGHDDWLVWDLAGQSALATNQTYHVGLSTRGASADSASLHATIGYRDAAGNSNWVNSDPLPIGTSWGRADDTIVVPSGMTPFAFYVAAYGTCPETWMASPTLSCGSPVTLASSAHTPYATQDHVAAEYATKAALKVTSDAVTAEVEERGKLAGRVGTLESTSGTHTSKLAQLAASITSLVKGESTYTDPDGESATSGIYSLVTQTRDSVTALFGQYTKTADLASTQAVMDAKKAGTDAASAASAAASAASAAQSTADAAKSTADELATMVRADADGVTVGKSADGETWSTGRTRMTADAFEVLSKAGEVLSSFQRDGVTFLRGKYAVKTYATALAGSSDPVTGFQVSSPGPAKVSGATSSLVGDIGGVQSAITAGWVQDIGSGAVMEARDKSSGAYHFVSVTPSRGIDVAGDMTVSGTIGLADKESALATRRGLRISQGSKVCHGHGTPWVTLFETWADFQAATGCYDSGTPTLVTMNGDYSVLDGSLSDCEIKGGDAVYVMARTTDGPKTMYSGDIVRINWICIW